MVENVGRVGDLLGDAAPPLPLTVREDVDEEAMEAELVRLDTGKGGSCSCFRSVCARSGAQVREAVPRRRGPWGRAFAESRIEGTSG